MDLSLFKKLFSTISQTGPANFELWNNDGPVFPSVLKPESQSMQEQLKALSQQIIRNPSKHAQTLWGKTTAVGVPIQHREKPFGAVIAYWENKPDDSLPDIKTFLSSLAEIIEDHLTSRKEVQKITEELSESFESLYLYSTIGTQVKTLRFSNAMLKALMEKVLENMRADLIFVAFPDRPQFNAAVSRPDISENAFEPHSFVDELLKAIDPESPSLDENYFIVNDSTQIPVFSKLDVRPYRFLAVKIQSFEKFYGWFGLVSFNMQELFRRGEMRLLISVAEQVGAVISNTDLYQDLERFSINMVKSLVFAIEAKDHYTRGHAERVHQYCIWMNERLKISPEEANQLKWASILHDIGKIGIPEHILNKGDRLTRQEYEVIKGHPEKGCNIIKPLEKLAGAIPGILYHHERYDGQGYPEGLKGEQIPFMARVISVADTFDAINSTRAYRGARSPSEAFRIIQECAGTQLDGEIVKTFIEVVKNRIIPLRHEDYN